MLYKQNLDNFTTGTIDEDGNFIGTVEAKINHLESIVHNLAPSSNSGSSAKIASGKTDIMKYKKIEDALGKVEHILTDSEGRTYTRQHILGKHDKDHMERILKFIGKDLSEGEDTDDPRYGTFENAIGDIIHILKLKEEVGSKSLVSLKCATMIKKNRKFQESSGIPLSEFQKFGLLGSHYTKEEFQRLEEFMPKNATMAHYAKKNNHSSRERFLTNILNMAMKEKGDYSSAMGSGKSSALRKFQQDAKDLFSS